MSFVHLQVHSNFSFLAGTGTVDELVERAADMGMKAVALTDTDGLYAVVPFDRACRRAGIRPIFGVDLTGRLGADRSGGGAKGAEVEECPEVAPASGRIWGMDGVGGTGVDGRSGGRRNVGIARKTCSGPASNGTRDSGIAANASCARVTLLARNRDGYAEISRIVTARHTDDSFTLERVLDGVTDDIYILSDDERILRRFRARKNLRVVLPTAQGRSWDERRFALRRLAAELGIETVASSRVFLVRRSDYLLHRVLTAIRTRATIGTLPPGETAPHDAYMQSPDEVLRVFADDAASIAGTLALAEECRVEIELGSRRLPRFPLPRSERARGAAGLLKRLAYEGLKRRLAAEGASPPAVDETSGFKRFPAVAVSCSTHTRGISVQAGRCTAESVPQPARAGGGSRPNCRFAAEENASARAGGGSKRRGAQIDSGLRARASSALEKELSVIEEKGLADYFLVCWDIVRCARSEGMRSLGRGSAGNSLVSFALGITHVNPLNHNLFFERFLNPERDHLPDFDIDFATDDRERVLDYIFERYGEENVAMIGTYSTFRARGAVRETAKALGIPESEYAPFVRRIPFFASMEHLEEACAASPAAAGIPFGEEPLKTILSIARRLGGFPRHMGTHPCGVVISPVPITDFVPLQRGDRGYLITQWSMHEIEDAGLLKVDIIGQKGLAVIEEAASMAAENAREGAAAARNVVATDFPETQDFLDDPATKKLIREGRTVGCFYIESPVMLQLLRQARCEDFEVLTALSSIIRPGVSNYGGKRLYLRRHLGFEPVTFVHPALEEVLSDTYGCLIYQEQVIRIAVAVAGMSYASADGLRRCMSFKNVDEESMDSYRGEFVRGALRRGIPREAAEEIFRQISSFAGYAFCKAHSASFAVESFESAYWKAHYPAEFMAAVLSNGGGYYSQQEYVEEARRLGLEIVPPDVNSSRIRHYGIGRSLRIGLMQVKGLSEKTAERVVRLRPYASLREFLVRVKPQRDEVEALVRCGAFASLGRTRPELLWELKVFLGSSPTRGVVSPSSTSSAALAGGEAPPIGLGGSNQRAQSVPLNEMISSGGSSGGEAVSALLRRIPRIPDYPLADRIALELETLDIAVSAHPLAMFEQRISALARARRLVRSTDLAGMVGRRVEIVGWKVTAKPARTQGKGEEMLFVTFSDMWGRFEVTFFPGVYKRVAGRLVQGPGPFLIAGRVESELGAETITAEDVSML